MIRSSQKFVDMVQSKTNLIDLQFEDVSFTVKQGWKARKTILKNVSGKFRAGELTAIIGPSGAGKSSLLNILTGFQKDGVQGRISSTLHGAHREDCDSRGKDSCYIMHDHRLNPLFTVQETMAMAADLKLGPSIDSKCKQDLINNILEPIGLTHSKDTRCESLSGGEKRRLSIALELIDNPPIMFIDEPTSGLDSVSSLQCIRMLKSLSASGRTIVCTIHQPSASIYEMFDHVYVLADGQCVYQGKSNNTVAFLENVGLPCPEYYNPADHLIEVTSGDFGNYTECLLEEAKDPRWLSNNYESLENNTTTRSDNSYKKLTPFVPVNRPSEFYRFKILLQKSYLEMTRDWTVLYLKVVLHVIVAIFLGTFYFDYGDNGGEGIANVGYLLGCLMYLSYSSIMSAALKFPSEVLVLKKEHFNNWYQLRTYYAAYVVSSVPIQVLFTLAFCVITYPMTGQIMQLERFGKVAAVSVCCTLMAEGIGIFFGTIFKPVNAIFLGVILLAVFMVLSGFFIPFSQMSPIWYKISYISYLAYGIDAVLQALYSHPRPNLSCPTHYEYCHYTRPTELLKDLGVDPTGSGYWSELAVLIGLSVAMKVVGFYALKRRLNTVL